MKDVACILADPDDDLITVSAAAQALGISIRAVQKDVQAGCDGILRLGSPGRGRGTLLDLKEYRQWRDRKAGTIGCDVEYERERAWVLLCEAALRVFQEHGGVTRQNRARSAELFCLLLDRVYPVLMHRNLEEQPPQMRTLFRVFVEYRQM